MNLKQALSNLTEFFCDEKMLNKEIDKIRIHAEKVKPDDIYISLKKGQEGRCLSEIALKNGASAIITEVSFALPDEIVVENVREAYSLIAKAVNENACENLKLIAVTGTNGKTTTTKIISDILTFSGKKVGVIGTLGAGSGDELMDTGFTTPDPEILHAIFKNLQIKGCEYVVMEASAHAIELEKLAGLNFEISVFTNLTQDHLDFFGNMENYFKAKQKLFSNKYSKIGIVYGDDEYGKRLIENSQIPTFSYGKSNEFDGVLLESDSDFIGSKFKCDLLGLEYEIKSKLVGDYNNQNLLAGCLTARLLGVTDQNILSAVKKIEPAEGRFNTIKFNGCAVIVDFAHTPDGLEKVLKTARKMTKSRLLCVFGCGGNRDKLKRPIMGRLAEGLCDEVYLTSDNPRFEKPLDIIDEIEKGMEKNNHQIFEKREDAIFKAISDCKEGDCLVIAGKGGEKYQDIEGIKNSYDDFEQVQKSIEILSRKEKGRRYEN